MREQLLKRDLGNITAFRWRGHEISRIEGLSDAVFAFAVTLLVVSLEVPKTFNELAEIMRGFGAFAISFALLFGVWFNHYVFSQIRPARHYHSGIEWGLALRGPFLRLSSEVPVYDSGRPSYRRA